MHGIPLRYGFAADPEESSAAAAEDATDAVDVAAIQATATNDARGLWRTWRLPMDGSPTRRTRRVYVIEANEDADLAAITGSVQNSLIAAGEAEPQVEVYPTRFELPRYHRFAQAYGELIIPRTDPSARCGSLRRVGSGNGSLVPSGSSNRRRPGTPQTR